MIFLKRTMSEQNNDNISQFFRKAVQKPKIRFVESDWNKLQARLDAASVAGASKHNHWKAAFIAAVALLFVSTALLLYIGRQPNTIEEKTDASNLNAAPSFSTRASSKKDKPSGEKQMLKNTEAEKPDENTVYTSHLSNLRKKEVKTPTKNSTIESSEEHPISSQGGDVDKATSFQNDASSDNLNKVTVMNQSSGKEVTSQSFPSDSSSLEKQKDPIVKSETNLNDSLAGPIKSRPSRWNVMLSLSPDFSSTDLDKFTTPGGAFGIAGYYSFSRAFSISTGVVMSHKLYWDNGNEYKPLEAGFWAKKIHGIVPGKIEGSCSVLEIPFGFQYYAVSTKKNKLYLASTFSSYIMFKESYQYIFDAPNPGAAQSWHAKKISYSLFSITNLAVGYERSISDRLMIGVSPYIKIPMSGIGSWANIKLYSLGAAFTLRYQFQKKKKPDRLIPAD